MDSDKVRRIEELREKVAEERTTRNQDFDFTTLNLPDPVPVRLKSRRCLDERPNRIVHLDWSKDKQRIVSCTDSGTVQCWNAFTGTQVTGTSLRVGGRWLLCTAFSANGDEIVVGGRNNKCILYSLSDSAQSAVVARHEDFVSSCCFARCQQELLTASGDKMCGLWNIETGHLLSSFQGHSAEVMSICMSNSTTSSVFLSASFDGSVRAWDIRTGKMTQSFDNHQSGVNSVCIANGGDMFATACQDCSVRLFDLRADAQLGRLDDSQTIFPCNSLSFSFSNRLLFGGADDYSINVWDTARMELNTQLLGHENRVSCVRTCPDGSAIASSSHDGTIRIWA